MTLLTKEKLRRFFAYSSEPLEYVQWLRTEAEMVGDLLELHIVPGDPKDDMVVATAFAAAADYLVTGDRRHLLPLGTYQGTRILTPREFLERI